jgi:hypothetical protein
MNNKSKIISLLNNRNDNPKEVYIALIGTPGVGKSGF